MKISYFVFAMVIGFASVIAADPVMRGERIALEMDRAESGYGSYRAVVVMTLRDRKGRESVRDMRYATLEVPRDGDKSMVIFERPEDVRGVAALTYAHKTRPDDQWLYLPTLRRVKRIASANQAGPFVGSEFAYEDIGSQEPEKYAYRYLREDAHEGHACDLIERYPVNPDSGYSRQVVWVERDRKLRWRVDFYDRKGDLLKTETYSGYRLYKNRFWRADEAEMVNHQTGKSTTAVYTKYDFDAVISPQDMAVGALKRMR